jgi:E3 ubiquitin-protein ligase MARCH6
MWFIKDPQDQNIHPIRDILDRPSITQLRKICVSGIMYSVVVVLSVASIGFLLLATKLILPFRWKNKEPLSHVPLDLLFLHAALPYTMHYFRPRRPLKRVSNILWRFLARKLRLTSFMFGERHLEEEFTPNSWSIFSTKKVEYDEKLRDGNFRRVPATDNIALPREMRATAAVNERGEAVDEKARRLIQQQNAEAMKAKRDFKRDYTVVYIPPYFKYRVILFMSALWVIGSLFATAGIALPILIGRTFFKLLYKTTIHDGYSFLAGFYLIWACFLVGKAIDRLDKRRQRSGLEGPRPDLRLFVFKRGFLWLGKISFMLVTLAIILPIVLALVVELYIVLPLRFILDRGLEVHFRVWDLWAFGLLYMKLVAHVLRIEAREGSVISGIDHVRECFPCASVHNY